MIAVRNVWHHYGILPVLKNISIEINRGELVAVMGPNGMGKSTLLAILGGVLSPIKGTVDIDGYTRRRSVDEEIAIRKRVVYLPADPYLPLHVTGREFVVAMGRIYNMDDERIFTHTDLLLGIFDLDQRADAPIRTYSTGQKKKIAICSALITEAPVLIVDEPFSGGLDSSALLALSRILSYLAKREDITVVMAVPVPELVEPLAHKIAVISRGEIVAYDTPRQLRNRITDDGGTLSNVLESMMHPEVVTKVDEYLKRR